MSTVDDTGTVHTAPKRTAVIAIDPGHGGTPQNGGPYAIGCAHPPEKPELIEKLWTLEFAQVLRGKLESRGHSVWLTRQTDYPVTFTERAVIAKRIGAELTISIHVNASANAYAHGLETYYMPDDLMAKRLAICIADAAPAALKRSQPAVFAATLDGFGDDAVLRRYEMPAALVEVGFASNTTDRAYLLSERGQEQLAAAICTGVERYLAEIPPKS